MNGELIPTGVTFGTGRKSVNTSFSGTAELNNIILDSGGNFSGGTGGGVLYSGGTNLYNIFSTTDANDITRVQPGTNINTGGTANDPIINLIDSPSVNNFSFSGRATGGDIYATNLTATTIYSGSSEMSDVIKSLSGASGNLWSASTGSNSIIQNNGTGNEAAGEGSFSSGSGNTITSGLPRYSVILGGVNNNIVYNTVQTVDNPSNVIIGGINNLIGDYVLAEYEYSAIIGGEDNTNVGSRSVILGGTSNSIAGFSRNSIILGGSGITLNNVSHTAGMQRAYVDEYIDLNPQTTLPQPSQGRMFFSGGSLNRIMYNTGGTLSDWIIM